MICDFCRGQGYLMSYMKHPGGPPCNKCHGTGWLPLWTSAERAGLKAMGMALRTFRPISEYPTFEDGLRAHRGIIRAYVQAARKSKEEK
jgi:hypothetical protein